MNKKLTQPSPEHIALSREWQRKFESGEFSAGYWQWYSDGELFSYSPLFNATTVYSYAPSRKHPHYATYCEWEAHKASGAADRGEYLLYVESVNIRERLFWFDIFDTDWDVSKVYRIEKTYLHPDNQKPKLKMLVWSKVPVGTMTDLGEIRAHRRKLGAAFVEDILRRNWELHDYAYLRILPTTNWTAIQDDEKPPVCEGLVIEYRYTAIVYSGMTASYSIHSVTKNSLGKGINAYRVIGLAEGWTDDPTKAVQS